MLLCAEALNYNLLFISIVPAIFSLVAIYFSYKLYSDTNKKRVLYEAQYKEKIQLLYMSRLAFGTIILALCFLIMSVSTVFLGQCIQTVNLLDFSWSAIKSVAMVFLAQLCSMGIDFVSVRLDYTALQSKIRLVEGMIQNSASFVWQKDHCGRYEFCDPEFAELFFGLKRDKESAVGFTDLELVHQFREQSGVIHQFGDMCVSSDEYTRTLGTTCRFVEYGYIGENFVMLDVTKTPLYDQGRYVGTVGTARRLEEDVNIILTNVQQWVKANRYIKLCQGAYYIKDPQQRTISDFMKELHSKAGPHANIFDETELVIPTEDGETSK